MNLYNAQERSDIVALHIFSVDNAKSVFFLFFFLEKWSIRQLKILQKLSTTRKKSGAMLHCKIRILIFDATKVKLRVWKKNSPFHWFSATSFLTQEVYRNPKWCLTFSMHNWTDLFFFRKVMCVLGHQNSRFSFYSVARMVTSREHSGNFGVSGSSL